MKFQFEIDDNEYNDDYGPSFRDEVKFEAANAVACQISQAIDTDVCKAEATKLAREKQNEIIDRVVEYVGEKILAKKQVKELMPSSSELAKADREAQKYFEQMIDRAIARKFK